mmetsp:Transcript_37102/g.65336  ORF Transcript_37102/g.65336 Transcript_37102/m.65336 type:complete len:779 (-) Transcript_37102:154-2490(-)
MNLCHAPAEEDRAPAPRSSKKRKFEISGVAAESPDQGVLSAFANAVVMSLSSSVPLDPTMRAFHVLRHAFLQEHMDASPAAAKRCATLRDGCAATMRQALERLPKEKASLFLGCDESPPVRVEVRGTAGRRVFSSAFLVGRAAECDVQVAGDPTVSRLQFIVFSLPKQIIIVDAGSEFGTKAINRVGPGVDGSVLPASGPRARAVLAFSHAERVTFQIGRRTIVTLGPTAAAAAAAAATATAAARQSLPNASLTLTPTIPDGLAAASNEPTEELTTAPATFPATLVDPPPVVTDQPVPASADAPSSDYSAQRPGSEEIGYADGKSALAGQGNASKKMKRCLAAVRASTRLRRSFSITSRQRLEWRCRAAVNCELMSEEQVRELETSLQTPEVNINEIREILDGLGVPQCSNGPFLARGARVRIQGLVVNPELNDATGIIKHWLISKGRWSVALDALGGGERAFKPENLVAAPVVAEDTPRTHCPQCDVRVAEKAGQPRHLVQCESGGPSHCSQCGDSPYHYHGRCSQMPRLRMQWTDWKHGRGRRVYQGLCQKAAQEASAQRRLLREAEEAIHGPQSPATRARHRLAARVNFIKGQGVRHFFTRCALCGSNDNCIVGPRFRCLHCPAFDCCLKCEPRLETEHNASHVFEILFECEFDWGQAGVQLPSGTRARIRQHPVELAEAAPAGDAASDMHEARTRKRRGYGMEGVVLELKRGKYEVQMDDGGLRHVLPQDLQPLLSQRRAQELLAPACRAPDASASPAGPGSARAGASASACAP